MRKIKLGKKKREGAPLQTGFMPPMKDPRAVERMTAELHRMLDEHEFSSIEDANKFLEEALASGMPPVSTEARTPLEQAQELMYEAWDSEGKRRTDLAHRALEVSPDCADAYVLLAEECFWDLHKAKNFYEQGVKAGERALGPEAFSEDVGRFWGVLETRPYMRAREGLAHCLWILGHRQQAIDHYFEMLRLNPNDNQGVRYILVHWLLSEGLDDALGKLLDQYRDDIAASWLYTRALWQFRKEGASNGARASLKKALKWNRYVPPYLLDEKDLPMDLPDFIGIGDENEAIEYVLDGIMGWRTTAGALDWLRKILL